MARRRCIVSHTMERGHRRAHALLHVRVSLQLLTLECRERHLLNRQTGSHAYVIQQCIPLLVKYIKTGTTGECAPETVSEVDNVEAIKVRVIWMLSLLQLSHPGGSVECREQAETQPHRKSLACSETRPSHMKGCRHRL